MDISPKTDSRSTGHSERSSHNTLVDNDMDTESLHFSPFGLENGTQWMRASIRKSRRIRKQPAENNIQRGHLRQRKSVLAVIKKIEKKKLDKMKAEVEKSKEETEKKGRISMKRKHD